jgi:hypothetical protein
MKMFISDGFEESDDGCQLSRRHLEGCIFDLELLLKLLPLYKIACLNQEHGYPQLY